MSLQPNRIIHSPPRAHHKRQQGVVIVVALFIVALVAAMSYVMMARLERDTRRTQLILRNAQAEAYAKGSLAWAKDQLTQNWEKRKPNQLVDRMPMQSAVVTVNGYRVASTLNDMQARFNVNNVMSADGQIDFTKLLNMVDPALSSETIQQVVHATVDWVTPGKQENDYSRYYRERALPYRAAHRAMVSATELRLVQGMTPILYQALQPYVTALPMVTVVNVQSASPLVLTTLSPSMSLEAANAIALFRRQTPFVSTQQFLNVDVVKNHRIPPSKVTVVSSYFLLETHVSTEAQRLILYHLLERRIIDNKARVTVLWQSKGAY